jgi:hypothetical protein
MNIPLTEGIYSPDNYEPSHCVLDDGTVWTAWAAYGGEGSRTFTRSVRDGSPGDITPLSPHICMQTRPICVPLGHDVQFVWLEKEEQTYSIWSRKSSDEDLDECNRLHTLPDHAKPWELQATTSVDDALWLCWAQSVRGNSTVECLRIGRDGNTSYSLSSESRCNYRPRITAWGEDGIYVVFDSYANKTYDIYGAALSPTGKDRPVRISNTEAWENRSSIVTDNEGRLWVVWVHCQDVIYQDSTIQQKYGIRGSRNENGKWSPLSIENGDPEIAPLHYGLLTDFPKPPNLGHMGRRLHPMLKADRSQGIWLFYEAKANEGDGTMASKGRLMVHRNLGDLWSAPLDVTEGQIFYELPHNHAVGDHVYLTSQDIISDELHLSSFALSSNLPPVPEGKRTVNHEQWKEIRLPYTGNESRQENDLPGKDRGRYQLYWADLHCHSAASVEMEGEPDELGHFARDKAGIDGLTVSDNDNFWNRFSRQNVRHLKDYEFDYVKGNALVLNQPGEFAMFPGYEMTITDQVDSGRDHRSVMSDDDEMEMDLLHFKYEEEYWADKRDTHKDTQECIDWFKEKGYLALPHPHHGKWNVYDTDVEWGIDVCAAWMINIELFDIYFKYLNQGHRFAFTASGDSHHRNPGLSGALTGIWAEELTRASFLDAIRSRRCFGTAGSKILVEFTIDDEMMGSDLIVSKDPLLKWRVSGESDKDYILRIHRDGRLMYDQRFAGSCIGELEEFMLRQYRPGKHYYHLEVTTDVPVPQYPANVAHARGDRAWSSPIWVETTG